MSHFCLISKEPENLWVPFKDPNPIPNSKALEPTNIIGDCSREHSPKGQTITSADFDMVKWPQLSQGDGVAFFRLIVTGEKGRYAVTRAYHYDEVTKE